MNTEERSLKLKKLKSKCTSIIEQEAKKQGIKLNINPITIVEYYESDAFKQQTKLQRIKRKFSLRNTYGLFICNTEKIYIFIDKLGKGLLVDSTKKFAAILYAMYHEYRHQLQDLNKEISQSEKFIIDIENFIMSVNPKDYNRNYCKYFAEIDACLYGYEKTLAYIKENEPSKYEEIKQYLEITLLRQLKYYQINYDFSKNFDKFYKLCRNKGYFIKFLGIPKIDIFIDKRNRFRPLSNIIESCKKENIDEPILLGILGSESYLNQLDISTLTEEEKKFMLNIIDKILENETIRIEQNSKYYEERIIKIKEYLKSLKSAFKKIKSLNLEIQRLRKYMMNQASDTASIKYYKKLQRIKLELLVNDNN